MGDGERPLSGFNSTTEPAWNFTVAFTPVRAELPNESGVIERIGWPLTRSDAVL